ncbi:MULTISPECIES: anti-sigma factor [unclassified Crossiella]|uniref:anti-sigma factor family protein n=1 Tax=unclassified Crossiella TaxID=2620835 RepID=UPI001FFFEA64|nr:MULTISPECIES: zf-HC2 domain-containing protein [unclassified Crossiella]MCK2237222.1 zf-HC2 domain-containing protein [Crossiella sp. S99.2]MCK2250877.1 zf-HC2 domain-containing protein [Crossiella sp. S99.1]
MTDLRGWVRSEQHLTPDAIVAFVDGELSPVAHDRASAHVARCPRCAAEVSAQRCAQAAVRAAGTPGISNRLMASLCAIPQEVELPAMPDELAVTADGQLVTVQRPNAARAAAAARPVSGFGSGPVLGGSTPFGAGPSFGSQRRFGLGNRRVRNGAGMVVSGFMLGALALAVPAASAPVADVNQQPSQGGLIGKVPAGIPAQLTGR